MRRPEGEVGRLDPRNRVRTRYTVRPLARFILAINWSFVNKIYKTDPGKVGASRKWVENAAH